MKALLAVIVAFVLTACSSNSPYGNFTKISQKQQTLNVGLAADSAKQLNQTYAPAATKFVFMHTTKDVFGSHLVQSLRDFGFAVAEFDDSGATPEGERLAYIIDYMDETNLIVTLRIGKSAASRAYGVQQNQLVPMGSWTRLE